MITCVSLNPSIDRTLSVETFVPAGLNRVCAQTDVAAGKGVNVALAAAALGEAVACIGFMYREGGALYARRLSAAGVEQDFVWCEGAVRVNMKVLDRARGEITELNASGTPVSDAQLEEMRALSRRHARRSDYLVLSGSLPPACPVDFYRTLAEDAAAEDCRVILDADGERLRAGLAARPFLIKPNRYELELFTGRKLNGLKDVLAAAKACVDAGARVVAVSMGGEGALVTDGREALHAAGLKVEVKSTVAAGDSMIAGLAAGFARGETLERAFRRGVAAATARCMTPPEEIISAETCARLMEEIDVEKMEGC